MTDNIDNMPVHGRRMPLQDYEHKVRELHLTALADISGKALQRM